MFQEKIVDLDSVKLNYAEGPASGPPVVFLHGIQGNWNSLMPLISMLGLRWHVFAVDFRGHGKSSWTTGNYKIEDYTEDIVAFLTEIVPEKPAIYGASLGGMVGIMVAALNPQITKALIVGDSLLYKESVHKYLTAFEGAQEREELIRTISDVDEMAEAMAERGIFQEKYQRYFAKCFTSIDPDIQKREVGQQYDCEGLLPKIACPTLLLQSALISDEDAAKAMDQLSKGYLVKFPDMSHMLQLDPRGYEVVNEISLFLESF